MKSLLLWWVCLGAGAGAFACESKSKQAESSVAVAAEPMGAAECATCNMVVREQPAPRAQLVHRDGTRAHFCSIGDMLPYLASPSPHGKAEHIFVEVMSAEEDPESTSTAEHPWTPAAGVSYVVGVKRPKVMGAPVLSYTDPGTAKQVAARHSAEVKSFEQLRQPTP